MRRVIYLVLILLLHACSCDRNGKNSTIRIGIDPDWMAVNLYGRQKQVNGLMEDLLLEISRYSGITFEKITANWDNLVEGMREGKYDVVITSLLPYNYNLAKYDFSSNFLDLGPFLIVPANSQASNLNQMSGQIISLQTGDPAVLVLQQNPEIILRNYPSVPEVLNAVVSGNAEAAVLDKILATNYVRDLYASTLKIIDQPLNNTGLRVIAPKDKQQHFIHIFDRSLEHLKKKGTLESLQAKWQLSNAGAP